MIAARRRAPTRWAHGVPGLAWGIGHAIGRYEMAGCSPRGSPPDAVPLREGQPHLGFAVEPFPRFHKTGALIELFGDLILRMNAKENRCTLGLFGADEAYDCGQRGATVALALKALVDQEAAEVAEGGIIEGMDQTKEANEFFAKALAQINGKGIVAEAVGLDIGFGQREHDRGHKGLLRRLDGQVKRSEPILFGNGLQSDGRHELTKIDDGASVRSPHRLNFTH